MSDYWFQCNKMGSVFGISRVRFNLWRAFGLWALGFEGFMHFASLYLFPDEIWKFQLSFLGSGNTGSFLFALKSNLVIFFQYGQGFLLCKIRQNEAVWGFAWLLYEMTVLRCVCFMFWFEGFVILGRMSKVVLTVIKHNKYALFISFLFLFFNVYIYLLLSLA